MPRAFKSIFSVVALLFFALQWTSLLGDAFCAEQCALKLKRCVHGHEGHCGLGDSDPAHAYERVEASVQDEHKGCERAQKCAIGAHDAEAGKDSFVGIAARAQAGSIVLTLTTGNNEAPQQSVIDRSVSPQERPPYTLVS